MSEKRLQNRSVTILGDSYSTFKGHVCEGNYIYYPHEGIEDVVSVEDTWWHQLVRNHGMNLLVNDSSSGTTVCTRVREAHKISDAFVMRMQNTLCGKEQPDFILLFGGTNDSWIDDPVGELQFENWTDEDLQSVLPAFCYMVDYVKAHNPQATIAGIINCDIKDEIRDGFAKACEHYGITGIRLHDISKKNGHPDKLGMRQIAEQVADALN